MLSPTPPNSFPPTPPNKKEGQFGVEESGNEFGVRTEPVGEFLVRYEALGNGRRLTVAHCFPQMPAYPAGIATVVQHAIDPRFAIFDVVIDRIRKSAG